MRRWRLARWVLWAALLSSIAAGELAAQTVVPAPTPAAGQATATPAPTAAAGATAAATATAAPAPAVSAPEPAATPEPPARGSGAGALVSSIAAGLVLLVVAGVVVALAVATYRLLARFGAALDQRLTIGTRGHWGGFGGGESGWDVSPALALLVAALVLAIATAGLGGALVRSALDWRQAELDAAKEKPAAAPASEKDAGAEAGADDEGGKADASSTESDSGSGAADE